MTHGFRQWRLAALMTGFVVAISGWQMTGVLIAGPTINTPVPQNDVQVAIFAGGCFWCVEADFDKVPGVVSTISGYAGGSLVNPSYEAVSSGGTGHTEVVKVVFDPKKVSYERLLYVYWRNVDPLTKDGQFCDFGSQYRTAIFYLNDAQRFAAEASKATLEKSGRFKRSIVTQIVPAGAFYAAESYHQNYYKTNSFRYNLYRFNCGRDARLDELWGKEARGGTH